MNSAQKSEIEHLRNEIYEMRAQRCMFHAKLFFKTDEHEYYPNTTKILEKMERDVKKFKEYGSRVDRLFIRLGNLLEEIKKV